jgi:predicted RNase H-like nuclease (RuvC/YqgF family)
MTEPKREDYVPEIPVEEPATEQLVVQGDPVGGAVPERRATKQDLVRFAARCDPPLAVVSLDDKLVAYRDCNTLERRVAELTDALARAESRCRRLERQGMEFLRRTHAAEAKVMQMRAGWVGPLSRARIARGPQPATQPPWSAERLTTHTGQLVVGTDPGITTVVRMGADDAEAAAYRLNNWDDLYAAYEQAEAERTRLQAGILALADAGMLDLAEDVDGGEG